MFNIGVTCSVDSCANDVLPVKCAKCDSPFCKEHYKSELTHNCLMSDSTCCNCGYAIPESSKPDVSAGDRLKQEREIFKKQQFMDQAKIRSLDKKLFDLSQDLEKARNDSIKFQEMREENESLSKDILVLGEMYGKAKEKLEAMTSNHFLRTTQISERAKIKTLERELDRERTVADNRTRERDWFRGRCSELEDLLQKKDISLSECRKQIEANQSESKAKLDAQSERINALASIKKQLSDHILELNRKLAIGPLEPRQAFDLDHSHENGSDQENEPYVDLS